MTDRPVTTSVRKGFAKGAKAEALKYYKLATDSVEKYIVYNEWAAKALSGVARISGKNINFDDLIVRPDFLGAEVPENIAITSPDMVAVVAAPVRTVFHCSSVFGAISSVPFLVITVLTESQTRSAAGSMTSNMNCFRSRMV